MLLKGDNFVTILAFRFNRPSLDGKNFSSIVHTFIEYLYAQRFVEFLIKNWPPVRRTFTDLRTSVVRDERVTIFENVIYLKKKFSISYSFISVEELGTQ